MIGMARSRAVIPVVTTALKIIRTCAARSPIASYLFAAINDRFTGGTSQDFFGRLDMLFAYRAYFFDPKIHFFWDYTAFFSEHKGLCGIGEAPKVLLA